MQTKLIHVPFKIELNVKFMAAIVLAVAAVIMRLLFWAKTGRYWEDSLTAVLHSENLVNGLGLTHYRTAEGPVQGFTSPLGVLIPVLGDLIRPGFGINLIKAVSAVCGGLAVIFMIAIGQNPKLKIPLPLTYLGAGYVAFEHHQILWGMSGMETQLATTILLFSIYCLISWRLTPLAISLGLCMLVRPDFFIWTLIVGLYVAVKKHRELPRLLIISIFIYLPWVIFTTSYYGSLIPNTIVAKGLGYQIWWRNSGQSFSTIFEKVQQLVTDFIFLPLGPSFAGHGSGFTKMADNGLISHIMLTLVALGIYFVLRHKEWELLPIVLFTFVYGIYFVFFVSGIFGWYIVPFTAVAIVLSIRGIQGLFSVFAKYDLINRNFHFVILSAVTALYLGSIIRVLPQTFLAEKQIQQYIENPVRKEMGLYLSRIMKEDESIGAEPLGYLSYFSRKTVYDWPGLASKKVVIFSRTHPEERSLFGMLKSFKPYYIVLREHEYRAMQSSQSRTWINSEYAVIRYFKADPRIKDILFIEKNIDISFMLLKKISFSNRPSDRLDVETLSAFDTLSGTSWMNNGGNVQDLRHIGSFSGSDTLIGKIISQRQFTIGSENLTFKAAGLIDGHQTRIDLVDEEGTVLKTMPFVEPGEQWQTFSLDVSDLRGRSVKLLLTDFATGFRGWFAVTDFRFTSSSDDTIGSNSKSD